MNNKEPQNQIKTTEDAVVNNRRRFIKGAGIATPIILTLSSSSAFGDGGFNNVLCLSQQLSGNASGTPVASCKTGNTPAFWANPINKGVWPVGTTYGTFDSNLGVATNCTAYTGGTTFSTVFGSGSSLSLREILCPSLDPSPPALSSEAIWATAWLNSKVVANYILMTEQLLALYTGSIAPPLPFPNTPTGREDFVKTTW